MLMGYKFNVSAPGLVKYATGILVVITLWLAGAESSLARADSSIVLITNKDTALDSITTETARAVFAMRLRSLPDGSAAHVFVLPDDNPLHDDFCKQVLGVYPHQLRLAWDRAVFSGTGQAPNVVESVEEMMEKVAALPGSIGYVQKGQADERVRILPLD
ncbi:hypothetical protein [Larsenimonas rhizosphaerae]|uniref:Phosphate ABC transporter substrate-binding protein n=1 Tax=Larsenimonas rhizosphaerae TaxID=2944682 RepID=A0AA42CXX3_9GAMM|nr:hypothetical protein [Larsenimonas rhizosphaerae]MCM2129716.1 hypothetical protein [Larsenimonas rhizosphaerae]MCX2524375.1 hypothetical protein [Larsenimonas rhizosphaerae]